MRNKLLTTLVTVFVIVGAIVLVNTLTHGVIQDSLYRLAEKPSSMFQDALMRSKKYLYALFNRSQIIADRDALALENRTLRSQIADIDQLKRDNEGLSRQLGVDQSHAKQLLKAHFFDVERSAIVSTIMINKGRLDGVQRAFAVIDAGNILIGTVSEVFDHTSRVVLIDDPRAVVSVRVLDSSLIAQSHGILDNRARINLVSKEEAVKENDTLVTSGIDRLPEGLIVGTVDHVSDSGTGLFKEVSARTMFDPGLGSSVFVIVQQ